VPDELLAVPVGRVVAIEPLQGLAGSFHALVGLLPQARLPRRDDGDLRHREDAVQQDQQDDQEDLEAKAAVDSIRPRLSISC
jgi:hypothetical protein